MRGYWFGAWCFAGALLLFAFMSLPSIGLLILPLAVVAVALLAWRAPVWPDSLGFISGFGLVVAFIGLIIATGDDLGGDPAPIVAGGFCVAAAGLTGYILAGGR
jgi:hypothetical protein